MSQKKYTDEFKDMIIELHQSGKPPCDTIREYGISSAAYYNWVNSKKTVKLGEDKFTAKDVKELKREISRLKEENEILKKAMTLFATR